MNAPTTTDRVEAAAYEHLELTGRLPHATDIAMWLCEADVAEGLYSGCSGELDMAAGEYAAVAQRVLGGVA